MSIPAEPQKAKLVVAVIINGKDSFERLLELLCARLGAAETLSPWYDFDFTDYYAPEMGRPLFRRFIVFKELIAQDSLPDIKLWTNDIENTFLNQNGKRHVNLDPGYLTLERFILATGKNFTHRVYLRCGIFADLTLIYTKGGFQTLPWTFPDYATNTIRGFLEEVRRAYHFEVKEQRTLHD